MARYGNNHKGGRPRGSLATHTLEIQEMRKLLVNKVEKQIGPIINILLKKAKEGNLTAIKEVMDRIFGRPHQEIGLDAPEIRPMYISLSREAAERYGIEEGWQPKTLEPPD